MRIAIGQVNPTLGNFRENGAKVNEYIQRAIAKKADLIVFPESVVFGYHPFDLLERPNLVKEQLAVVTDLHRKLPKGIVVVLGALTENRAKRGRPYFNSAVVLQKDQKPKVFHKQLLPTGDVFDEARFIEAGTYGEQRAFRFKGLKIGITICEDIWAWDLPGAHNPYVRNPLRNLRKQNLDVVLNLSASPYFPRKIETRKALAKLTAKAANAPFVYANLVGAQDEIIFDGQSFAMDRTGKVTASAAAFLEDLTLVDLETGNGGVRPKPPGLGEELRSALVLGLRDFGFKQGFKKFHLGLSGGVDSALVACLAADAFGPKNVTGIALPGPFNSDLSLRLAKDLALNLGINFLVSPIGELYNQANAVISSSFKAQQFSVTQENLQARIRGTLLMAFANHTNSILLGTANKSELAVGYSTLYGDLCGALLPIGDLTKQKVYLLCQEYNKEAALIPNEVIDREPTAELRPNQRDSDSLPDYESLDKMVEKIVEEGAVARTKSEKWLEAKIFASEFKRWQAPPILKVSKRSFGRGRRWPIVKAQKHIKGS